MAKSDGTVRIQHTNGGTARVPEKRAKVLVSTGEWKAVSTKKAAAKSEDSHKST